MNSLKFLSAVLLFFVCVDFMSHAGSEATVTSPDPNTVVIVDDSTSLNMTENINGTPLFFLGNQPIDWGDNNTININVNYAQTNQQITNNTTTTFNDATIDGSGTVNIGTTSNYMNANTYQGDEGLVIGGGGGGGGNTPASSGGGVRPWWQAS